MSQMSLIFYLDKDKKVFVQAVSGFLSGQNLSVAWQMTHV